MKLRIYRFCNFSFPAEPTPLATYTLPTEPSVIALGGSHLCCASGALAWFYPLSGGAATRRQYPGFIDVITLAGDYAAALFQGRAMLHTVGIQINLPVYVNCIYVYACGLCLNCQFQLRICVSNIFELQIISSLGLSSVVFSISTFFKIPVIFHFDFQRKQFVQKLLDTFARAWNTKLQVLNYF